MKELKSEVKKLRFTKSEVIELQKYLDANDLNFSEFVTDLLNQKIKHESSELNKKTKKKTEPPRADPDVLFQIGKIGNNLNQIAKSLNILKNDPRVNTFSFLECFYALSQMQKDLHSYLGELPKIERREKAVTAARERAISKRSSA